MRSRPRGLPIWAFSSSGKHPRAVCLSGPWRAIPTRTPTGSRVALTHGVCVTPSSVFDPEGKNRRAVRINVTPKDDEKPVSRLTTGAGRGFISPGP